LWQGGFGGKVRHEFHDAIYLFRGRAVIWWLVRFVIRWSLRLAILFWPVTLVVGAFVYMAYFR